MPARRTWSAWRDLGAEAGGVDENAAPDIDFKGDAVAFITDAKLNADDTDATADAYVRREIGAQAEMTRFVSFTTRQTPGADTAAEVALSGDGSVVAWSNGFNGNGGQLGRSIFMASLLPAVGPAQELDVSRSDGFGSGGGNPAFEPVSSATRFPVLLYFRSDAGLSGADTNDSADLYAAEIAHPGDGGFVHLESSGKANGAVDAGAGTEDGSVVAFASAASSLPGADGGRGEVYVRAAGTDVNVSQPAGVPPRTSPAGSSFLASVHAVSDDGQQGDLRRRGAGVRVCPGLRGLSRSGGGARSRLGADHARQRRAGRFAGERLRVCAVARRDGPPRRVHQQCDQPRRRSEPQPQRSCVCA